MTEESEKGQDSEKTPSDKREPSVSDKVRRAANEHFMILLNKISNQIKAHTSSFYSYFFYDGEGELEWPADFFKICDEIEIFIQEYSVDNSLVKEKLNGIYERLMKLNEYFVAARFAKKFKL